MIEFLVDQNFNEDIVDGLTRRDATLQLIRVRDVGLAAAPDPAILDGRSRLIGETEPSFRGSNAFLPFGNAPTPKPPK